MVGTGGTRLHPRHPAATDHVLGALHWSASQLNLPTLADGGFQGTGIGVHTPIKHNKPANNVHANRTYTALLRGLRAPGERGFALLTEHWQALQRTTASPRKIDAIVHAALTLTHYEHGRTH